MTGSFKHTELEFGQHCKMGGHDQAFNSAQLSACMWLWSLRHLMERFAILRHWSLCPYGSLALVFFFFFFTPLLLDGWVQFAMISKSF